jgi:outer membrane protein assembly factor BamB
MMPGIKIPFFFFFILALLFTPFPAMGLEYPVQPTWEIPLILTDNPANLSPLLHIAEGGQIISLNYPYSPGFFVYDGNGSLLFHTTLSAEKTPWVSSITPVPDGTGIVVTQLIPGCCHGSVSNTSSNKVTFYDRSGRIVWDYVTYQPPLASTALPNTGDIVIGTEDGRIICLDRRGSVRWSTVVDAPVHSLTTSADGNTLVATGDSNYDSWIHYGEPLSPYDLFFLDGTGAVLGKYQTRGENTVAVSRNGSVIAVIGGRFGNLMMFNRTGTMTGERSFPGAGTGLYLSDDGTRLVVETSDGTVYTLDETMREIVSLPGEPGQSIAVSDTGDVLARGDNRNITLYRIATGEILGTVQADSAVRFISAVPGTGSFVIGTGQKMSFFPVTVSDTCQESASDAASPAGLPVFSTPLPEVIVITALGVCSVLLRVVKKDRLSHFLEN